MVLKYAFQPGSFSDFSRDGDRLTLQYEVWESNSATVDAYLANATTYGGFIVDAQELLLDNTPSNIGLLFRDSINISEDDETIDGRLLFDVNYSSMRTQRRWAHDTTGGTLHITNSYQTTRYNRSGFTGIDYGGLIGMTDDGPEGVERVIPALRLNCRFIHHRGRFATETDYLAYAKLMASLTGTTNNTGIFGFAAGELLFMGSTGESSPGYEHEFDYTFLASANATGLTIAQAITGVAKKGHDYLWLEFAGSRNPDDKWVPSMPISVHVERIYEQTDFSLLEIGS